jgi:hypothetical protein
VVSESFSFIVSRQPVFVSPCTRIHPTRLCIRAPVFSIHPRSYCKFDPPRTPHTPQAASAAQVAQAQAAAVAQMDAASAANLASLSLRSRFQLPAQLLGAPASARVLLANSYLLPGHTVPMAMENHLLMAAQQQQA